MKLTIGIPTYDDPMGIEWTLISLQDQDLTDVEILVCDNHPIKEKNKAGELVTSKATRALQNLVHGLGGRYIELPSPVGTAPPRNELFKQAAGDVVLVMDGHVKLQAGAVTAVKEYFDDPANALDLICGPRQGKKIQADGRLEIGATHYADVWRSEMWGIWAQAWGCPCGKFNFDVSAQTYEASVGSVAIVDGSIKTSMPAPAQAPTCTYHKLAIGREQVTSCPVCNKELPELPYIGHEDALAAAGYTRRCWSGIDTQPFEITGLGLGMFAMRKDAWPGFPKDMVGFGGGELHMHTLVRRNGGRAICLPTAGWWHCFHRSGDKVPYPLTLWQKVRNYVIWRRELDLPLDPVYVHFVTEGKKLNQREWDYLVEDPVARLERPAHLKGVPDKQKPVEATPYDSVDSLYAWTLGVRRDCVEHLPTIKELASQCNTVISFVKRREWDVAVAAGDPANYYSHNLEHDAYRDELAKLTPRYTYDGEDSLMMEPMECDMLLIDTQHTSARLSAELLKHAPLCKRWIVLRGTKQFGYKDEAGAGAGLLTAAYAFMEKNPQWHRVAQLDQQYGLTILSCDPAELDIDQEPGTQLHKIFKSLGVEMAEGCACRARIAQMNTWGVEGCKEHRQEIIDALNKDKTKYSWGTAFKAALGTLKTGIIFKVNPTNPLAGLVDEAIRRTEQYYAARSH